MLADLHIHSKYSNHALYSKNIVSSESISSIYPRTEYYTEMPPLLSQLLIDGTSHIKDILLLAHKRGLKAIAITDHNTTVGNLEAQKMATNYDIIVVPAMEISTLNGELLVYGISTKIDKGLNVYDAIKQIHSQGGLAVAAHPFNIKHPNADFSRIDEELLIQLDLDGIEVFDQLRDRVDMHFLDLAKQKNLAVLGGSDAHLRYQIGKGVTVLPDTCKIWEDLITAIRNRETYATGLPISKTRVALDMLWCQTLGRFMISRRWFAE